MDGDRIFVFGSNIQGIHGKGSARWAEKKFGARRGIGVGLSGQSYAIPTRTQIATPSSGKGPGVQFRTLPITEIREHVEQFVAFAREHPELVFDVVRIGCGNAGYDDGQMAPLFHDAPANVKLPYGWRAIGSPYKQEE